MRCSCSLSSPRCSRSTYGLGMYSSALDQAVVHIYDRLRPECCSALLTHHPWRHICRIYRAQFRRSGRLTGRYLAYKKDDCTVIGRSKIYLTSRNDPRLGTLWRITGDEREGVKIEAVERGCREKKLYFKPKTCSSSFVGLSSKAKRWRIKNRGESNDYRWSTITANPSPVRCRGRVLGSNNSKRQAKLVAPRGKDTWGLEFCGNTVEACSPQSAGASPSPPVRASPPPVRASPPPPRVPSDSPSPAEFPPDVQQRRCASTTPYYDHTTHGVSDLVRRVCTELWDIDRNEVPLPNAGIGREIVCRRDSYELPTISEWSTNQPAVCGMIADLAAAELGVDRGDLVDPCGMYFWCITPAVERLQWTFRMKTTYGDVVA